MYKVLAFYFSLDLPRTIVWNILKTLHQKDNESRFEEEKLSLKSTTDFESTTEKTLRSRQWRKTIFLNCTALLQTFENLENELT